MAQGHDRLALEEQETLKNGPVLLGFFPLPRFPFGMATRLARHSSPAPMGPTPTWGSLSALPGLVLSESLGKKATIFSPLYDAINRSPVAAWTMQRGTSNGLLALVRPQQRIVKVNQPVYTIMLTLPPRWCI